MHIPVVKDIVIYNQLVTFTGTFSALIRHDVYITDSMDDVNSKMTGNKLLRKLFKEVSLYGRAWMEEETNIIHIRFHLSYEHTLGGSNGNEIGKLLVYTNKNKVKYLPY